MPNYYKEIYEKYGEDKYLLKVCEELAELQVALLHYRDGKVNKDAVIDEMADVMLQLDKVEQFICAFDPIEAQATRPLIKYKHAQKSQRLRGMI